MKRAESIDIDDLFDDAWGDNRPEFRDPFLPPYGNPKKTTATQLKVHEILHRTYEDDEAVPAGSVPKKCIAMIGAKGSGKTYTGGMVAASLAQMYPGSVGCLISNTYPQAKDNGAPHLIEVCNILGYDIEFFTTKKIYGRPYTNVFRIELSPGVYSFVLLRSYDAVGNLEGIELDWVWSEEGQDAEKNAFVIVWTRNRGKGGPNLVFWASMPEDEDHWQYDTLEEMGFVPESEYTGVSKELIIDPETGEETHSYFDGIMYEISVFENKGNVGNEYISSLYKAYDDQMAERYIHGRRGGSTSDKVMYQYQSHLHRSGRMSEICCNYDPYSDLIVVFDFNLYPMSCSTFQIKEWNDAWWSSSVHEKGHLMGQFLDEDGTKVIRKIESLAELGQANREIGAQVGEFEAFSGGTEAMMKIIYDEYKDHHGRIIFVGDATGNRKQTTSPTQSDWDVIAKYAAKFRDPIVKRGLIANSNIKTGAVAYSNPLNREAIMNANRLLKNALGQVSVCFLPTSKLKSKGCAKAVGSLRRKPNGDWDVSNERSKDIAVPRSHFVDIFKYFCWYLKSRIREDNINESKNERDWSEEDRSRDDWRSGFLS